MVPTMLVAGFVLGLLPRWWRRSSSVAVGLAAMVSLAFGFLVGEPVVGGSLALGNAVIGLGVGRAMQFLVPAPDGRRRRVA